MIEWLFLLLLLAGIASIIFSKFSNESIIFLAAAGVFFAAAVFGIWTEGLELEDGLNFNYTGGNLSSTDIKYTTYTADPFNPLWVFNMIIISMSAACFVLAAGGAGDLLNQQKQPGAYE